MIVICDSSALINLAIIDKLHLLKDMFGIISIPPGVYNEVVYRGIGKVGSEEVRDASYIHIVELHNPELISMYIDPLSSTDAEVIILAKELNADLVITRDRYLRKRIRQEGLVAINTLTSLVDAKSEGFISEVKPLLDNMINEGILIRQGTYREILRQAGEL